MRHNIIIFFLLFILNSIVLFAQNKDVLKSEINTNKEKKENNLSVATIPEFYNEKNVKTIIDELIPHVEEINAKKFKEKVQMKFVEVSDLSVILESEIEDELKNVSKNKHMDDIKKEAKIHSRILVSGMLGKYGFKTKTLYLVPKNFNMIMKKVNIDEKFHEDILKLIIAHELCHTLQDQHANINDKIFSINNNDSFSALNALIEGHAMFVMEKIGIKLNLNGPLEESMKLFSMEWITSDDVIEKNLKKILASQFNIIYIQGKKFIDYHYNEGGVDKIWLILDNPPKDSNTIFYPEQYGKELTAKFDLEKCLSILYEFYNEKEGWKTQNIKLSKFQINAAYVNFKEEVKNKITSSIINNRAFIAQKENKHLFNITILILDQNLKGTEFIGYMEEFVKDIVEKSKHSNFKFEDLKIEKFKFKNADDTSKVKLKLNYMDTTKVNVKAIRISKENVFIEVILSNYELKDKKIRKIVKRILNEIKKQKKS